MRHTLFTMLAVLSLSGAYAQKNSILLFGNSGGAFGESSNTSYKNSSSSVFVNVGGGYQFSDHITVGLVGSYRYSSRDEQPASLNSHQSSQGYAAGLFGRYTHYLGDRFFVYLQADATYSGQTPSFGPISANLTPAVGCFIYKGWAVNLNAGHVGFTYQTYEGYKESSFNYTLGSFGIGFSKNFARKVKAEPKQQ